MPHKNREYHNRYVQEIYQRNRAEWFEGKTCILCGATENLELDHLDPTTKIGHRIWNWNPERRATELAKCRPLCKSCHADKSRKEVRFGSSHPNAKLQENEVREMLKSDDSYRVLANRYGISVSNVARIKRRNMWKHVQL